MTFRIIKLKRKMDRSFYERHAQWLKQVVVGLYFWEIEIAY